jgi:hypothetical protein
MCQGGGSQFGSSAGTSRPLNPNMSGASGNYSNPWQMRAQERMNFMPRQTQGFPGNYGRTGGSWGAPGGPQTGQPPIQGLSGMTPEQAGPNLNGSAGGTTKPMALNSGFPPPPPGFNGYTPNTTITTPTGVRDRVTGMLPGQSWNPTWPGPHSGDTMDNLMPGSGVRQPLIPGGDTPENLMPETGGRTPMDPGMGGQGPSLGGAQGVSAMDRVNAILRQRGMGGGDPYGSTGFSRQGIEQFNGYGGR